MSWYSGLEEICRADVPLRDYTWFGLGGPARWFFTPRTEEELSMLRLRCAEQDVPWCLLGSGTNILVREEGFNGAVIKLTGDDFCSFGGAGTRVHAGAGADFPKLVKHTVESGLAGLENLAGIPGTVGGAIRMNAGGRYGDISQYVCNVHVMRPDGRVRTRSADEMEFAYRSCKLDGAVVTSVTFLLEQSDRGAVRKRFREIWSEKSARQPTLAAKSAGCIFKNPAGHAAGALIDQVGLKGQRCGGAEISPKHANFIVAHPGATARNVLDLIVLARDRVRKETGLELELEVEIW
ncbi:MAG: UDP-N-acetylmuramate dehydrogenase [Phycisphaerae bacterium]|nr:UDP-N-acetylmuramate dehydrogenase [Phycisphaerae bacterium]